MRRLAVVCVSTWLVLSGARVDAGASGSIGDGGIGASAGAQPAGGDGDSPTAEIVCEWGGDIAHYGTGRVSTGAYVYAYIDQLYWRLRSSTGEVWVQSERICRDVDGTTTSSIQWRQVVQPDPRVLAESVYDEVVRQVPVPEPSLSPVGPGYVNLGMWLAVAEPEPISVTANAGPVWATTSADLVSTSFDMGDGTIVNCEGAGDPIPESELDSVDESPTCGHTYTTLNGREPFTVALTSTWRVSWTGSGGVGGDLGTLDRSASLEYRVLEIQTVGS